MKDTLFGRGSKTLIAGLGVMGFIAFGLMSGCGSTTTNSNPSTTATSTLAVSPSVTSLGFSQQSLLTASGGTAPYTFTLAAGSVGTLAVSSTTTATYTAPTTGAGVVQINVTDAAASVISVTLSLTGAVATTTGTVTNSGVLTVTPVDETVGTNQTVAFTVSGGSEPYTFEVVSGGGSFSNISSSAGTATYTAPSATSNVTVEVLDSLGNTYTTYIYVTSSSTSTSSTCEGSFTVSAGTSTGTLTLIEDGSGNIAGTMNLGNTLSPISGSCSATTIQFSRQGQNQTWYGTIAPNANNLSQLFMFGTISGSSASWTAHN